MNIFEGSKNFLRDFIHVDDVVDVNMFFLNTGISGIYNCGSGVTNSFYRIAEILKELNGKGRINFTKFPKELIGKYQKYTKADLNNLRKAGYKNNFKPLEIGIKEYYKILSDSNGYFI